MQLSQLEKDVFQSVIWPAMSLRSSAGRSVATNKSKNPLRKLLSIATSTAGILGLGCPGSAQKKSRASRKTPRVCV